MRSPGIRGTSRTATPDARGADRRRRRTITSHVKRIRQKFPALDPAFDQIDTVYGMGYRWRMASASRGASPAMKAPRFALGIRAQLPLVLTVFLAIPLLG